MAIEFEISLDSVRATAQSLEARHTAGLPVSPATAAAMVLRDKAKASAKASDVNPENLKTCKPEVTRRRKRVAAV
jgi:hypothetical protein